MDLLQKLNCISDKELLLDFKVLDTLELLEEVESLQNDAREGKLNEEVFAYRKMNESFHQRMFRFILQIYLSHEFLKIFLSYRVSSGRHKRL